MSAIRSAANLWVQNCQYVRAVYASHGMKIALIFLPGGYRHVQMTVPVVFPGYANDNRR